MSKRPLIVLKDTSPSVKAAVPPSMHTVNCWVSPYADERSEPDVFMLRSVYCRVNDHAASLPDREIGGMLIGNKHRTPDGRLFILVDGFLEARHTLQGPSHLTFTSDTLVDAITRLEDNHPNQEIVGWYHTHPGLGIFLSSWDVFIHRSFFQKPWHVALVIDPIAHKGGFFHYTNGNVHPGRYMGFSEIIDDPDQTAPIWHNLAPGKGAC